MTTSVPTFNFLVLLIFEIKRGVPKFNVGASAVPRTLKLLCVLKVLGKVIQRAKFQHRMFMHHAVMGIYISYRLTIICAKKWFFWGFEGEDVKILSSDPQNALPCVNTRPLIYRVTKLVQRPEL